MRLRLHEVMLALLVALLLGWAFRPRSNDPRASDSHAADPVRSGVVGPAGPSR